MEYLGLQNKLKAEVHPEHYLMGPMEGEEEHISRFVLVMEAHFILCEVWTDSLYNAD
jgi:hypothetical protein